MTRIRIINRKNAKYFKETSKIKLSMRKYKLKLFAGIIKLDEKR